MPDPVAPTEEPNTALIDPPEPATPEPSPDNFGSLGDAMKELAPELTPDAVNKPTVDAKGKPLPVDDAALVRDETTGKFLSKGKAAKDALASPPDAVEKKPEGDATPEVKPDATRDADLEVEEDQHRKPKTKQVITKFQTAAIQARNERDAERTAKAELEARLKETEEKLKVIKAPKEMEEELTTLRSKVRELDITKDPELQKKYDARIKANGDGAMAILKKNGLFSVRAKEGDKDVVRDMTADEQKLLGSQIEKGGTGIRGLAKYVRMLENADLPEDAEQLRQLASESDALERQKAEEINKWSQDYEGLKSQRLREQQAQREGYTTAVRTHGERTLNADLAELQKQLPFLNRPAEPAATDSPEVKAAKLKAVAEYNGAIESLKEGAKAFNSDGLPPEKAAEVNGRMTAAAIQSVILKNHVLPRLLAEAKEKDARIAELEAAAGKTKKAQQINRAHSAALTQPDNKKGIDPSLSLDDAFKTAARDAGISVD